MNPSPDRPLTLAWSLLAYSLLSLTPTGAQTESPPAAAVERLESLEKSGILTSPPSGTDQTPVKPAFRLASVRADDGATVESLLDQKGMANSPQNVALFRELNPDLQSDQLPAGNVYTLPEVVGPPSLKRSIEQGKKLDFQLHSEAKQTYLQVAANLDQRGDFGARFNPQFARFSEMIQNPNQVISEELIENMSSNAELALLLADNKETIDPEVWRQSAAALEKDLKLRAKDLQTIHAQWSQLPGEKSNSRQFAYVNSPIQRGLPTEVSIVGAQDKKPLIGLTVCYLQEGWYSSFTDSKKPSLQQQAKNQVKRFPDPSSPCRKNVLAGEYRFWGEDPATGQIVTQIRETVIPEADGKVTLRK